MLEPVRVVLLLSLTFAAYPLWPAAGPETLTAGRFLVWLGGECMIGVAVGLLVGFLSEALVFGAQAVVMQAGFSYASAIDPSSQADSTVLQMLAQLTANLLFFCLGADALLLRTFARSLESLPPGSIEISQAQATRIIAFGGEMLSLGVRLALPLAGLLLLTDLTLAFVSRLQSQLQLLSLAFPAKMLGTLAGLAALAPASVWIYRVGLNRMAATLQEFVH